MTLLEPRTWSHVFLHGPDEARLRELRSTAERLKPKGKRGDAGAGLLSDDDPWAAYDAACRAADDFAEEAEPRGVKIVLRSLGSRKAYRRLKDAHPARDGDEDDGKAGFNVETFPEELVSKCLASPALGDAEREAFLDSLTDAQFELCSIAAFQLHENLGADPKGRLLSGSAPT